MRRLSLVVLSVALAITGCGFNPNEPSDKTPSTPLKIHKKYIDPRKCERRKNSKCVKWDDKDWVFITNEGSSWDVDEKVYNSYKVGDYWPR